MTTTTSTYQAEIFDRDGTSVTDSAEALRIVQVFFGPMNTDVTNEDGVWMVMVPRDWARFIDEKLEQDGRFTTKVGVNPSARIDIEAP